jgi:protein gp37
MAKRFGWEWGHAVYHPERLEEPTHIRQPSRIFVGSMTDLGRSDIEPEWLWNIISVMRANTKHTYILLTKRPGAWLGAFAPYAWVGVTAENQEMFDLRWPVLVLWTPNAKVRFVSVEPMLGPVTLAQHVPSPDWVICGPETGPGARPFLWEWRGRLGWESGCLFDKGNVWLRRQFPRRFNRRAER